LEEDESFSVKSLYLKLVRQEIWVKVQPNEERRVFRHIWKFGAPSKVIAFVWNALLDRIPTGINLEIMNCLPLDIGPNCVWCVAAPESSSHLFLHCDRARNIWLNVMLWLYLNFVMPPNLFYYSALYVLRVELVPSGVAIEVMCVVGSRLFCFGRWFGYWWAWRVWQEVFFLHFFAGFVVVQQLLLWSSAANMLFGRFWFFWDQL